jgi:hypothetical protein
MTGYTVHTGSNEKFSSGWDRVFGGHTSKRRKAPATDQPASAAKPARSKRTKR